MLIFTGRFQPFHNGHLSIIKKLNKKYPNETICIAVIKDFPTNQIKNEFDLIVDSMLVKEKNPFDSEMVLNMIEKTLINENIKNTVVTLMPRASKNTWPIILKLFDTNRQWVFTDDEIQIDDWENKKINFYRSQGEDIITISIKKNIDGSMLRDLYKTKNFEEIAKYVPTAVLEYLKQLEE